MPDNRSRFQIFKEDVLKIRVKRRPDANDQLPLSRPDAGLVNLLGELDSSNMVDISELNKFRTLSDDRTNQYRTYDEMKDDSVISSALEMYADDSTQYSRDGSIIWADSDEPEIATFANRLIDILNLNSTAWSHIYSLCLYGDLYLETFRDNETDYKTQNNNVPEPVAGTDIEIVKNRKGYQLEEYVEAVPDPATIFDLVEHGKTVGFVKVPDTEDPANGTSRIIETGLEGNHEVVYDPRKYIHISLSQDVNRHPETLTISFRVKKRTKSDNGEYIESNDEQLITKNYTVRRGKSILHDIYKTYQELKLMEDSLLLNRVTRSSIIRLLQVEVGDMPRSQVANVLRRLKQMMEQRNMMDKDQGTYRSQSGPGPIDNILYVPTYNGKGQISSTSIGGDVDVKSITDLDYFSNKLFAGLKIPKRFLGQSDGDGLSSGTSLTKQDARYARTIKRVQNAYISGITTLINLFCIDKGLEDYVNKFSVRMVSPATTEDAERNETMSDTINLVSAFMDLIGDAYSPETQKEVFEYFVSIYLSESDVAEILKKDVSADDDEGNEFGDAHSDVSGSQDIDFDIETTSGDEDLGFGDETTTDTTVVGADNGPENGGFGDFEDAFTG